MCFVAIDHERVVNLLNPFPPVLVEIIIRLSSFIILIDF